MCLLPNLELSKPQLSKNLKSARELPAILHDKLNKEIRAGRFQGPFDSPPFFNLRVSPLGIVPKKESGKYRLIHHLSYPKGGPMNDGIPEDDTTVTYILFDRAVEMVRKAGPGTLMAKSDIESAFRLLPVHPDCYYLLGAMFEDKYYFDTCLPMGCSISCHYFEMFSTFLEWVARKVTRLPSTTHYLDDFLFVGPANSEVCHYALVQFKDVMSCFGVPLSSEKTIGPVSVITFLGIEIDSVAMEFRLPQDKISKLQELIAGCLSVDAVWSAAVGTAANAGMPAFGLGCPGELIPLLRSSIAPATWKAYGKAWDEWCLVAAEKPVLKGWRRASARSDQRRPISFTLLSNLVRVSGSVCDSTYEATLISAAFSLAFFGAMRVSEILPSSRCRAGGLQLEDLVICDDGLRVRVRRSKTDQEGRGMDVIWRGTRGLTWSQVLPEIVRIGRVASSPTVVVIHAGGNDLASFPLAELLTLMRADLDKLPDFFPVMRLVWSEMIPRLVWRGARELGAMERSRRTLNQRISRFIRFKNGVVVRHHRLEGDNSGFLLPDGVHLNDAGLDIFLDGLREGVVQALHSLVAAAKWVVMRLVKIPAPGVRRAICCNLSTTESTPGQSEDSTCPEEKRGWNPELQKNGETKVAELARLLRANSANGKKDTQSSWSAETKHLRYVSKV
ncbi:unnamed protein product [Ranitomeya imitator]|uniref:ribonuclease H n=1 Tax=Ranitomeya imitator TaxID=111125 RepID=A0ABN9L9C8_9NEOB|nr:unnamed protein product [Ranitomeya imitator]